MLEDSQKRKKTVKSSSFLRLNTLMKLTQEVQQCYWASYWRHSWMTSFSRAAVSFKVDTCQIRLAVNQLLCGYFKKSKGVYNKNYTQWQVMVKKSFFVFVCYLNTIIIKYQFVSNNSLQEWDSNLPPMALLVLLTTRTSFTFSKKIQAALDYRCHCFRGLNIWRPKISGNPCITKEIT